MMKLGGSGIEKNMPNKHHMVLSVKAKFRTQSSLSHSKAPDFSVVSYVLKLAQQNAHF